jgi:hypothetical protein
MAVPSFLLFDIIIGTNQKPKTLYTYHMVVIWFGHTLEVVMEKESIMELVLC